MTANPPLDCIIVGYNDVDFRTFAASQQSMASRSGAYHEVKTNSVLLGNQRYTYMELINQAIARATGEDPGLNVFNAPLLAAVYLKSFLAKRGWHSEIVNFFTAERDKLERLLAEGPRAVAITTTFYVDHAPIVEIVELVRTRCPAATIIVGGPHIVNVVADLDVDTQDFVFAHIGADVYIIDSQGEGTLAAVLGELRRGPAADLRRVANLCYRETADVFRRTLRAPEENDLDENTIDWRLFAPQDVTPITYLRTARSCPFACSFCNYPTLAGTHVVTDVDHVEAQLRYLHEIGTRQVVFIDDTFNVPLPRFKNLLRMMIKNRFDFQWISFFRCSNADEAGFDLMAESGCMGVLLGIESGDAQILKYMNKAATPERYRWGIDQLKRRGIDTFVSLICGFPGETQASVMSSVAFVEETAPTFFNVQLYYHDTRAPISKQAAEFGIEGAGYNWRHRSMEWREAARWATYMFKTIHNAIPLTLYGFSLWGIAYLVSAGISLEQIKEFGRIAKPMLLRSLDDLPADFAEAEARLTTLFGTTALRGGRPVGGARAIDGGRLASSGPTRG